MYTCINHSLPGLFHMFSLQRFSSIFESTVGLAAIEMYSGLRIYLTSLS